MTKNNKIAVGAARSTAGGGTKGRAATSDAVGRKLKSSYSELLREPIPDKFLELLRQLDKGRAGSGLAEPSDGTTDEKQRAAAGKKSID